MSTLFSGMRRIERRESCRLGGGTILSFTPEKELALSALAPEQFPEVREQRATACFEFISEGP
jgi:hypothetical protein